MKLVKVTIADSYKDMLAGVTVTSSVSAAMLAGSTWKPEYWSRIVPELEVTHAIEEGLRQVKNKTQIKIVCDVVGEIDDDYIAPAYRRQ